jgi:2-polyprenyl-3-methyl-5-hydroxy-6-metoxy-1,4-benzoquinol methylase
MQYEPIKKSLHGFFTKSLFMRKTFYFLLDILLLRAWYVKKVLRKIASRLSDNACVLDAGSGFGQYSWRMSSLNDGWKIKAVDINSEQVEECNDFFKRTGRSERVKFETCDLTGLNETDIYDFIITIDVMEHIEEDDLVFRNFFNAMKKKGILLISTPSDKGGSDIHHNEERSFIDEHVRGGYSKEAITKKLKTAGFDRVDINYTYGKAGSLSWVLSMKYPVMMLNRSYLFLIILPFYYLLALPLSFVLNFIDLNFRHETGTGLLVIAEK